jgi:hypothetical protein
VQEKLIMKSRNYTYPATKINTIYQSEETSVIFCPHLDNAVVDKLCALPFKQIILYSDRPNSATELLAPYKSIKSISAIDAVLQGSGVNNAV